MTSIELIIIVAILATIVLHCFTLLLVRDTLRTLAMRGSTRRAWPTGALPPRVGDAELIRQAVNEDARDE